MTDSLLDLTFNGTSGQTAVRHECHLGVQRSQSGLETQSSQGYHCQWAEREGMWEIYCICVCRVLYMCRGWGFAVCKEKEQIDGAERETHFSKTRKKGKNISADL